MYAQMRAKKNELLSNLGAKNVRVMDKKASVIPSTPTTSSTKTTRTASPTPRLKKLFLFGIKGSVLGIS